MTSGSGRRVPPPPSYEALPARAHRNARRGEPLSSFNVRVEVVTPIFGGGTQTRKLDDLDVIRPPTLRGHLRFWWRALFGHEHGNPKELFAAESALWGKAAADGAGRSPVEIRVDVNRPGKADESNVDPQQTAGAYALWPARGDKKNSAAPRRDLDSRLPVPKIEGRRAHVTPKNASVVKSKSCLYLQDLDLPATESESVAAWAGLLAPLVYPGEDIFTRRFAVVDDDTMEFLCETATQVDARVRIDDETRTVASGALWLEESLPPETLLFGLLAADRSRKQDVMMEPEEVLAFALPREEIVQLGGKATTGRGRCRLIPVAREGAAHVRA